MSTSDHFSLHFCELLLTSCEDTSTIECLSTSIAEILSQHLTALPLPLHEKIPTISPAVEQVVMRTLEKDPNKHFAGVQEFAHVLEQASQPEALTSQQAGIPLVPQSNEPSSPAQSPRMSTLKQPIVPDRK
jgi:hypothetical protein